MSQAQEFYDKHLHSPSAIKNLPDGVSKNLAKNTILTEYIEKGDTTVSLTKFTFKDNSALILEDPKMISIMNIPTSY